MNYTKRVPWFGIKDEYNFTFEVNGAVSSFDMSCYCHRLAKEANQRFTSYDIEQCNSYFDGSKTTVKAKLVIDYS